MATVQRAMLLVSASSLLVPVVGVLTAPVLAHALGAAGRGESAAGTAPFLVAATAGSLGIPQAITYYVAQRRRFTRQLRAAIVVITLAVGLAATAVIIVARGYLSGGDADLAGLIVIGALMVTPALLVGLLRGLATGLQMWREVALERVITTGLKAVAIVGLAVLGRLDVLSAVLVLCLSPILGATVYVRVLGVRPEPDEAVRGSVGLGSVVRYGSSVWMGSVATMLMARVNELFVIPLSDAQQLGLLVIAVTISDIPYVVTQAVRDVLFGASSRQLDHDILTRTSRLATAGAVVLTVAIGATLPLWIGVVFGQEFRAAVVPTYFLLLASVIAVPGLIAGVGLEASGKPHVRSWTLVASLVLNVGLVFALTPSYGSTGAASAVFLSALFASAVTVVLSSRTIGARVASFVGLSRGDVHAVLRLASSGVGRVRHRIRG